MYGVYIKCIKFEEYFVAIRSKDSVKSYRVKGRQALFKVLPEKTVPFKLRLLCDPYLTCDSICDSICDFMCDYIENSGLREITFEYGMTITEGVFNTLCNCKYLYSFIDLQTIYSDRDIYKIFKNKNISTFKTYTDNNILEKSDLVDILLDANEEKRKQARNIAITALLCLKPTLGKDVSRKIAEMVYYDY